MRKIVIFLLILIALLIAVPASTAPDYILLETGDKILLESGDKLLMETAVAVTNARQRWRTLYFID